MVVSNVGAAALKTVAYLSSSLCDQNGAYARRDLFAKSAIVSFAVQNKEGNLFHSMVSARGMATIGLMPSSTGNMRLSFRPLEGRRPIQSKLSKTSDFNM